MYFKHLDKISRTKGALCQHSVVLTFKNACFIAEISLYLGKAYSGA